MNWTQEKIPKHFAIRLSEESKTQRSSNFAFQKMSRTFSARLYFLWRMWYTGGRLLGLGGGLPTHIRLGVSTSPLLGYVGNVIGKGRVGNLIVNHRLSQSRR